MATDFQNEINDNRTEFRKVFFNNKHLILARVINFIFYVFTFFKFSRKDSKANSVSGTTQRIVLLESHLIGDVIMGLPCYRAIRKKFPEAQMIFWGNEWGRQLLEDQDIFDDYIIARIPWAVYDYSFSNLKRLYLQAIELKKMKPDIIIDFRGDIRNIFLMYITKARRRISFDFTGGVHWLTDVVPPPGSFHLVERNLSISRYLGADSNQNLPFLSVPKEKQKKAKRFFENHGLNNIVFVHPGASQLKRIWDSDKFAKVIDYLKSNKYSPVLLASPNDKEAANSIKSICHTFPTVLSLPLNELPAHLVCGKLFIGLDSGIGHIAASIGLDVITLFGPQLPTISCPRGSGKLIQIIKGDFDCRPCQNCKCSLNNACMKAIEADDVITAIEKVV